MGSGIYVAAAGAVAQSTALDVTSNNIANASTTGFQAARVSFAEALSRAKSPDVALVGNSTRAVVDGQQGDVTPTGNSLDVALQGDGYLGITTPQGVRYTRAGAFEIGPDSTLVTSDGFAVRGVGGAAITIPPEAGTLTITGDGAITGADGTELGRLELSRFPPGALTRDGNAMYASSQPPTTGDPPRVVQGALEGSNVNVVRGVVDLVKVSRTYESLMRLIEGFSTVENRAARELGGPK